METDTGNKSWLDKLQTILGGEIEIACKAVPFGATGGVIFEVESIGDEIFAVVRAAEDFYMSHEVLGWGGHGPIGTALAALKAKVDINLK